MRAAVFHGRGDVRVEDVPKPVGPRPGEVILDVMRAAICGTDATEWAVGPKMISLDHPHRGTGHVGPVVMGHEFVGVVSDAADDVDGLSIGDRLVPGCGGWCGSCLWCRSGRTHLCRDRFTIGLHRHGGLAEKAMVPASMCRPVPAQCSDEVAAVAQPFAVALHALSRVRIEHGPLVVIGTGGIGALLIVAAAAKGYHPLIAVDISQARRMRALELGADHAFNADDPELKPTIDELTNGDGPETVIEASGAAVSPVLAVRLVQPGGRVVLVGMQSAPRELDLFTMAQWEIELIPSNAHVCETDLPTALEMLANEDLAVKVIRHRIRLSRVVDDGLARLSNGTAEGKIIIDPWA